MSSVGAKLSRHVLGMKFMRKSKEQLDKSGKSNTVTAAGSVKSEASTKLKNELGAAESSSSSCQLVEELWSYNQCERYIMGRQSYGGFNPVVEKNLKKGVWRPFYLDNAEGPYVSSDEDEDLKKQSDVDVSDEEMAKTYGSLIGTLAKRFKGKRNKNKKNAGGKNNSKPNWNKKPGYSRNSDDEMESRRNIQKRQRESTGSAQWNEDEDQGPPQRNSNRPSPSKRRGDNNEQRNAPPQKRRKFWKPSD